MINYLLLTGIVGGIYLLATPLFLLYLASLLAFLLWPFYRLLFKYTKNSTTSSLIAITVLIACFYFALLVLIPAIYSQVSSLSTQIKNLHWPELIDQYLPQLNNHSEALHENVIKNLQTIGAYLLNFISSQSLSLAMFGGKFYLVVVMTFYMLKDWALFACIVRDLPYGLAILHTIRQISISLSKLIVGQTTVIGIMIVFYLICFWMLGLQHSWMLANLAGLSSFVPYLGVVFSSVFIVLSVLNTDPSWLNLGMTTGILLMGNIIESGILAPYFIGTKLRIHPLLLVVYLMCFGALFGLPGVILAFPNAAIAHVILKQIFTRYNSFGINFKSDIKT